MPVYKRVKKKLKSSVSLEPIVQLWVLRILTELGGHRDFVSSNGFRNDALAESLGYGRWIDPEGYEFDQKKVRNELRKQHQLAESSASKTSVSICLAKNIKRLANLVGLTEIDCRILEFVVLINNERPLDEAADFLGYLSSIKMFHALSIILSLPEADIRNALSAQSILTKSGLVTVDRNGTHPLRSKLDVLSNNFADHIYSSDSDPVSLLRDTVTATSAAQLSLKDYEHISDVLGVLNPYLKKSVQTSRKGVNIFICIFWSIMNTHSGAT